uniref:Diphthami_syn_2 domain-containing protein n=1 Tax=Panagrellus redivivus TaxID=6233 RepID=A0A7E4VQH1_PANRE
MLVPTSQCVETYFVQLSPVYACQIAGDYAFVEDGRLFSQSSVPCCRGHKITSSHTMGIDDALFELLVH